MTEIVRCPSRAIALVSLLLGIGLAKPIHVVAQPFQLDGATIRYHVLGSFYGLSA